MDLNKLSKKEGVTFADTDFVGGSRILDTDVYSCTVKLAYLSEAKSGAMALNLELETDQGKKYSETTYMTSGTVKGGGNTYKDKEGNDQYLPGFIAANSLALLTVGQEIGDLIPEEKTINIYNYELKKDVATKVQMYTDMLGKQIKVAIERQVVDKNKKNDAGQYVSTGETREQNEIVKYFRDRDSKTVTEIQAQVEEAAFINVWLTSNKGQVRNKATGASAPAAPGKSSGGVTSAAAKTGAVKSLFA